MKKVLFAVLIAALIVVPVAGCGGGGEETASTDTPAATPTDSTTTTAAPTGASATTPASSLEGKSSIPRAIEYSAKSLPGAFEKAIDDGFVVVVAFYDPDESISTKVQDMVEEVIEAPDYKDQIEYFSYEIIGKTSTPVAKLTTALGAKFLPHVTIINSDKEIVFEDSGFTEIDYFEHALYNAVYKDKSPAN